MIIESVRVRNFRCILDETLSCDELTVLVGPNGAGKSSFLEALDKFYTPNARYTEEDFHDGNTEDDIVVTVTFRDLIVGETELFQRYVENGRITVEKVMGWPPGKGSQRYHGTSIQNLVFDGFRQAKGGALKGEYNKLRRSGYDGLPEYTTKVEAERALREWETENPASCERRRDNGQFFGFKEVGEAHLERFTRFIPIPAVRDASDEASEGRGSSLKTLMDLVVRSVLANRTELRELQEGTQERYERIVDPDRLEELRSLETGLSSTLRTYVPDARVKLKWLTGDVIEIPLPKADVKLVEDGYASSVECTGHGLQRAFILTLLQHLAVARPPEPEVDDAGEGEGPCAHGPPTVCPNLILGIEEPELYQHPNRQRHLARILWELSSGGIPGVAERTQVIHSTHSPLFVDIQRFGNVRVLRKELEEEGCPKRAHVVHTTLDRIARIIWQADGRPGERYTGETLAPRLRTLMTPWMNEGFFADVAVLVEGEEDRAALLGMAGAMGHDLERLGISVIPCMGKTNLDRPAAIFRELGIPVYVVWDGDHGRRDARPEENHRLLRLHGRPEEDWPHRMEDDFACFERTLGDTLREEIGPLLYDSILAGACERYCIGRRKYASKNPTVMQCIISEAQHEGAASETLERIVTKVLALLPEGCHAQD